MPRLNLRTPLAPPALAWAGVAAALAALEGRWSLGSMALLLVLGATLASVWLTPWVAMACAVIAVLAFNWFLVVPRYTLAVQSEQDLMLLVALLAVSLVTSVLTARLRRRAVLEEAKAAQERRLHALELRLRLATSSQDQAERAEEWLRQSTGLPAVIWRAGQVVPPESPSHRGWQASQPEVQAIGPGTGRYEQLDVLALPLWAGPHRVATVVLGPGLDGPEANAALISGLRPALRLLAQELARLSADEDARAARERLQMQQMRTTLLAAISHDYRTPLATITAAASSLLGSAEAAQVPEAARAILQEAQGLSRMTTHILQLARLDSLSGLPDASCESLEELCGAVLAAARRRHPARALAVQVEPGMPWLVCDPVLVVQLLDNLLENALAATGEACEPVRLLARTEPTSGAPTAPNADPSATGCPALVLEVLDRGPGVPEAWRDRVFERFVRVQTAASEPRERAARGVGLGLAFCQEVARVHGAHIELLPRPGGGTQARVRFPAERSRAVQALPLADVEGEGA